MRTLRCAKCQITVTGKLNHNGILCPLCEHLMAEIPTPGNLINYPCTHSRLTRTHAQEYGYVCEECGKLLDPLDAADILNGQLGYQQLLVGNLKTKLFRIQELLED